MGLAWHLIAQRLAGFNWCGGGQVTAGKLVFRGPSFWFSTSGAVADLAPSVQLWWLWVWRFGVAWLLPRPRKHRVAGWPCGPADRLCFALTDRNLLEDSHSRPNSFVPSLAPRQLSGTFRLENTYLVLANSMHIDANQKELTGGRHSAVTSNT